MIAAFTMGIVLLCAQVTTVDEAIEALDRGQADIPAEVGDEAAQRLDESVSEEGAADLCRVALAAKSHEALQRRLVVLLTTPNAPLCVRALLRAAGALPEGQRELLLGGIAKVQPEWRGLTEDEEDAVGIGAADLFGARGAPAEVVEQLQRLADGGRPAVVARLALALGATTKPAEVVERLAGLGDLPPAAQAAAGDAIARLAYRDEAATQAALAAAQLQPSAVTIRGLGGLPLASHDQAAPLIADALATGAQGRTELLLAGLAAGRARRMAEALVAAVAVVRGAADDQLLVAAIEVLGALGTRDARTIDPLIACLKRGGKVADAALVALRSRTGAGGTLNVGGWEAWRDAHELPGTLADLDEERLAKERRVFDRQRRRR